MDFSWSPDDDKRFAQVLESTQDIPAACADQPFDRHGWQLVAQLGLTGATVAAEHAGGGHGAMAATRLYEAAGQGCRNTGLVFAAAAHLFACAVPLQTFGSTTTQRAWLPRMAEGDAIAANAITEDGAGSDVSAMATTAEHVPGGYRLNGAKSWVSNGPVADVLVTYAVTSPRAGHLGITGFVVPVAAEGVRIGPPLAKGGLDGCLASTVTFDDVLVPAEDVLGRPGDGMRVFQHSMRWERTCLFGLYVGLQQRLLLDVVAHATTRRQFGKRLSDFQAVSCRVADMALRLESARHLLYRAAWGLDTGEAGLSAPALSKLAVSESAIATALDAVQLFGSRGYLSSSGVETALRDSVATRLFSGSSEIQKQLVAAELGL